MHSDFRVQEGERIYAIGDCHGRGDLFEQLLGMIREDNASRQALSTKIVVLGDVIDRGPGSALLVQRMIKYARSSDRFIVLMGNHEQIMVAALRGDLGALQAWIRFGGKASLLSWGVPEDAMAGRSSSLLKVARSKVPAEVIRWMAELPLWHRSGDVLFVHAGIRPGLPLSKQDAQDLLWIREEFLEAERPDEFLVIHGHSASGEPDVRRNRVGIDTAAFSSGQLTAIGLAGGARWFLTT